MIILYMTTTVDDLLLTINISGFPFNNNSYDYSRGQNTGEINMSTINIIPNDVTNLFYYQPSILTFSKNQLNCDIKIDLKRVCDNKYPNLKNIDDTPAPLPNMIFYFDIYGVEPSENYRIKYLQR